MSALATAAMRPFVGIVALLVALIALAVLCAPVHGAHGERLTTEAADVSAAETDPKAQLEQIMADPLFERWQRRQIREQAPEQGWLSRHDHWIEPWRERVRDFLRWLFDRDDRPATADRGEGAPLGTVMRWLGWIVAGGLGALVLVTLARMLRVRSRADEPVTVSRGRIREALESGEALAVDSDVWHEQAQHLADTEDLRLACRAIYLALLAGLHERRKIDFRPHRTNWMHVRHYRGSTSERAMLAELTRVFDDAWYGHHPPDRATFDHVRRRVAALVGEERADG